MKANWNELIGMTIEEAKKEFVNRGWECYYEMMDYSCYIDEKKPEDEPLTEYLANSKYAYSDHFEAEFEDGICVECGWVVWED